MLPVHFLPISLFCICVAYAQQSTYKAAVVEYAPKIDSPQRVLENTEAYVNYMEQAAEQFVDIIVFPEDGLTGWQLTQNTIEDFSTAVPDPDLAMSPCSTPSNYSKFFVDLSCAARTHKMYTVVNLIERDYDSVTSAKIYHNTNVVFDKNGGVIARFRKVNLFNEPVYVPGNSTVTFKTNFGVTFAMFICFDIMFKNPSIDTLSDPTVNDVVYSTAWFSELPFYEALSIQHGYAKSHGVNLLASGLNWPAMKNGGSGIYLADGSIADIYISGGKGSKIIIHDVPIITKKSPPSSCSVTNNPQKKSLGLPGGKLPDISSFRTSIENTSNYTFKSLNLDKKEISETICSGTSNFCCSFNITVSRNSSVQPNYVYKLLAYYGVTKVSMTRSFGLRNCGIVACLNDTVSTCGGRHSEAPTGIIFERISMKGNFNLNTTHPQPATLTYDLKPLSDYSYCINHVGNEVEIEMSTTQKLDSLLTFGIHGRDFSHDDQPSGPINSACFFIMNIYMLCGISALIFMLLD